MEDNKRWGSFIQDMGMAIFLASIFASALVVSNSGTEVFIENNIMMISLFAGIIFVVFGSATTALVVCGLQILIYATYKIFNVYVNGTTIRISCYLWLVLPFVATGAMILFYEGRTRLEAENRVLLGRVDELVTVDPLTGLYNLKSFYHDIHMQVKYSERNNVPLTLMIVQLRHKQELKKIFTSKEFDGIKQKLAQIVEDSIRVEDRIYCIDEMGGLACILTCDDKGAAIIGKRIHAKVKEKESFEGIAKSAVRADSQIAFIQYNENYKDIVEYKKLVEGELQYDV